MLRIVAVDPGGWIHRAGTAYQLLRTVLAVPRIRRPVRSAYRRYVDYNFKDQDRILLTSSRLKKLLDDSDLYNFSTGALMDFTHSYDIAFYVSGGFLLFSAMLCYPVDYISRWEKARAKLSPPPKVWSAPGHYRTIIYRTDIGSIKTGAKNSGRTVSLLREPERSESQATTCKWTLNVQIKLLLLKLLLIGYLEYENLK